MFGSRKNTETHESSGNFENAAFQIATPDYDEVRQLIKPRERRHGETASAPAKDISVQLQSEIRRMHALQEINKLQDIPTELATKIQAAAEALTKAQASMAEYEVIHSRLMTDDGFNGSASLEYLANDAQRLREQAQQDLIDVQNQLNEISQSIQELPLPENRHKNQEVRRLIALHLKEHHSQNLLFTKENAREYIARSRESLTDLLGGQEVVQAELNKINEDWQQRKATLKDLTIVAPHREYELLKKRIAEQDDNQELRYFVDDEMTRLEAITHLQIWLKNSITFIKEPQSVKVSFADEFEGKLNVLRQAFRREYGREIPEQIIKDTEGLMGILLFFEDKRDEERRVKGFLSSKEAENPWSLEIDDAHDHLAKIQRNLAHDIRRIETLLSEFYTNVAEFICESVVDKEVRDWAQIEHAQKNSSRFEQWREKFFGGRKKELTGGILQSMTERELGYEHQPFESEIEQSLVELGASLGFTETPELRAIRESLSPQDAEETAMKRIGDYHRKSEADFEQVTSDLAGIQVRIGLHIAYASVIYRGGFVDEAVESLDAGIRYANSIQRQDLIDQINLLIRKM